MQLIAPGESSRYRYITFTSITSQNFNSLNCRYPDDTISSNQASRLPAAIVIELTAVLKNSRRCYQLYLRQSVALLN